jgi:hypothetical protein
MAAAGRQRIQGNHLAAQATGLLGAQAEGRNRAFHLGPGELQGLAGLCGQGAGELLGALLDPPGDPVQDPGPAVGRQAAKPGEDLAGALHGPVQEVGITDRDGPQDLPVILVADLQAPSGLDPLAVHIQPSLAHDRAFRGSRQGGLPLDGVHRQSHLRGRFGPRWDRDEPL